MPFKDFTTEILTSADVDLYLMSQVIIRCTSSTRPASPAEGWHIYETDTQLFQVYKSGSWVRQGQETKVAAKASTSTAQTYGTSADIAFATSDYDYGGMWSSGANTRLTIPAGLGGLYDIRAAVYMTTNSQNLTVNATAYMSLRKNGTTTIGNDYKTVVARSSAASDSYTFTLAAMHLAVPGDYFEIRLGHQFGGGITFLVPSGGSIPYQSFSATRIRE